MVVGAPQLFPQKKNGETQKQQTQFHDAHIGCDLTPSSLASQPTNHNRNYNKNAASSMHDAYIVILLNSDNQSHHHLSVTIHTS
jgi:hypothetical protein